MIERVLEFAGPGGGTVKGFPLDPLLWAWFALMAPGRPLADKPTFLKDRTYNWGTDEAYRTAEGDGILIAQHWVGALPGEGIDNVLHVRVRDEVSMEVVEGHDYTQPTFEFRLSATADTIDVATDALLQVAAARGLVFVRRDDQPAPRR